MSYDTTDQPRFLFADLDEKRYQSELALLDRYHAFSAELLRIALVGLAAFGFILKEIFVNIDWAQASLPLVVSKYLAIGSVLLFGVSAMCSLAHRYRTTEAARFFFYSLRLQTVTRDAPASLELCERDQWLRKREEALRWGPKLKLVATLTLAFASAALAVILILRVAAIGHEMTPNWAV